MITVGIGAPAIEGASVTADFSHLKGDKVIV